MKNLSILFVLIGITLTSRAQEVLTNQSIISMSQAKVSRTLMIEKINLSQCRFDMSTSGILSLKSVDVAESVMEAMLAVTRPTDMLTNEDVIRLNQARLSRKLITQKIQAGPTRFEVTTDGVIQLKTAKVPEPIIKIMMTAGSAPTTPGPKSGNKGSARLSQASYSPGADQRTTATTEQRTTSTRISGGSIPDCTTWTDKFTKKTVRASQVTLRGWKPGAVALNTLVGRGSANAFGVEDMEVNLIFRRDGNDLTLVLYASKPGIHTMFVASDKPLMFLMQDGSVAEFMPAESSESDYSWGSGYSMDSEMLMYYHLSEAQARLLTQQTIKEYRLNLYNRKFIEDKVNASRAMQVRGAAQCVLD